MANRWCYIIPWKVSICVPPKCGSSAFKQALITEFDLSPPVPFRKWALKHPDIIKNERGGVTTAVIRNPIDRFKSLYKNKVLEQGRIGRLRKTLIRLNSPEELLAFIELVDNDHWTPQSTLIGGPVDELIRTESLADWWDRHNPQNPMGRRNVTNSADVELSDYVITSLQKMYAEDFELWERAK